MLAIKPNYLLISMLLLINVNAINAQELLVPSQHSTIQAAINASNSGDSIRVSAGTYNENITLKSGVNIYGCGPSDCIIQGNGSSATIFANQVSGATIDGFTITGGRGYTVSWSNNRIMGGGIFADSSSLNIGHNKIISNSASFGGGIALMNSQFNITGNEISQNNANTANSSNTHMGGGIYLFDSSGEIKDNTINANEVSSGEAKPTLVTADSNMAPGAGVLVVFSKDMGGDIKILHNTISNNIASGSQYYGGGIYMYQPNSSFKNKITILNNKITGNKALDGGAIAIVFMSPIIMGNTIESNTAHWGGGIYGFSGKGYITHNNFIKNQSIKIREGTDPATGAAFFSGGGGVLCDKDFTPFIAYNSFTENTTVDYGGGLEVYDSDSSTIILNNLFSNNSARFGGGVTASSATPLISRNYFKSNTTTEKSGAGLFIENTSDIQITNNVFSSNTAKEFGGGTSLVNVKNAIVNNNTFDGNNATSIWAGGLHTYSSSFSMLNNQFTNNINSSVGADNSTINVQSNNNFYNNSANVIPDCYGCSSQASDTFIDPDYVNMDSFRLNSGSKSINAGVATASYNDRDGTVNDIGAYGGPANGYIITPDIGFTLNPASLDSGLKELLIPALEVGSGGARHDVSLSSQTCSSMSSVLSYKLTGAPGANSQEPNMGSIYYDSLLLLPEVAVASQNYSAIFSLFSCTSDPTGLYIKLDSYALK